MSWLRRLAGSDRRGSLGSALRGGAWRVVGGLTRIGGTRMVLELADFLALAQGLFSQMVARVERTQRWLASPATDILLVTAVRDDAARGAQQLADALAVVGLPARATIVNRALPARLGEELAALGDAPATAEAAALLRYARAYSAMQSRLAREIAVLAPVSTLLPATRGLDAPDRLDALASLGERLLLALPR